VVAILPGDAGGRGRQGGSFRARGPLVALEFLAGVALWFGKIWSKWFSSTWAAGDQVSSQGKPSSDDRRARGGVVLPGASESSGDSGGLGGKFLQPGGSILRSGRERRERRTWGTYRRGLEGQLVREITAGSNSDDRFH
jgi:hypothetical protein